MRASLKTLELLEINKYAYVGSFRWHHFDTGLVLVLLSLLVPKNYKIKPWVLGVGAGLMADEPNVLLIRLGFKEMPYWSTINMALVFFIFTCFGFVLIKNRRASS